MFTIQDYIDSLNRDKESLVANLTTKGISASDSETFTTLVPKVLDIISVNNQSKSTTITSNTTTTITPDEGYTGLSSVEVTTNVALDLSEYFTSSISNGSQYTSGILSMIKKIPANTTVNGTNLSYAFNRFKGTIIPLLDTSNVTNMSYMFYYADNLTSIPTLNTSQVTTLDYCFNYCHSLTTAPSFNTSNVTTMRNCFSDCVALKDVPIYNWSKITGDYALFHTFYNCRSLTDTSLDNILQSCISATIYNGTKTLAQLGITTFPASRIQALPHYQDFIDAGWTID